MEPLDPQHPGVHTIPDNLVTHFDFNGKLSGTVAVTSLQSEGDHCESCVTVRGEDDIGLGGPQYPSVHTSLINAMHDVHVAPE